MTPALVPGWLLGGRVRHDQPADGHRTGIEPVLLAASIPARPGERVLEGGTGSGAALLCLAARVAGIGGVGVERDPAMAAVARGNFAANERGSLAVIEADLTDCDLPGPFDHAFANPPWHDPAGTASPDRRREAARRGAADVLERWAGSLGRALRPRGTLTFIVAAGVLPQTLAACARAGCGSPSVLPLWPKAGRGAKLLLLRTVKSGASPCRVLPGLTLHAADGRYTAAAEAILRDGAALEMAAG